MRTIEVFLIGVLLAGMVQTSSLTSSLSAASNLSQAKLPGESRQLIVVTTANWNAVDGELRRYERTTAKQSWQPVGEKIAIVVGRNGMAWGKGLHGDGTGLAKESDPIKKEGDGRSPAGIFSLSSAFGYAAREQAGKVKLPYVQATKTLECVDDSQSVNYNRIVERTKVAKPDWKSSEQMRLKDDQYRWGVFVDHNAGKPEAGCGSCIFLHIWNSAGKGTAGCTAMESAKMEEVLFWLEPKKHPVIVQLPQAELERLSDVWHLPR